MFDNTRTDNNRVQEQRSDTTPRIDEEESLRESVETSATSAKGDRIATRECHDCGQSNLSVSGGAFIYPLYWYQYNTNQPTKGQVVVSPVIPRLSSLGVVA